MTNHVGLVDCSQVGASISGAIFSPGRKYRYALWRVWDRDKAILLFLGFNPSDGGEVKNDPTIYKLIDVGRQLDFGGLYVGNPFALVSKYPYPVLFHPEDSVGPENDRYLQEMAAGSFQVVVGWGNAGAKAKARIADVLKLLGRPVFCFKVTKAGQPAHPLYLDLWRVKLEEYHVV